MPSRRRLSAGPALEALACVSTLGFLLFVMRDALFFGTSTLAHDNLYWGLPIYHYFVDGLMHGQLRLWNPFSHTGEPLLPALLQLRLLGPETLLTVLVGSLFTSDPMTLFAWDRLVKALLGSFGIFLVCRMFARHLETRLILMPATLLSGATMACLSQNGIMDQFYHFPYLAFFLLRLIWNQDDRWTNWIGAAVIFGLSLQSYFSVGSVIFAVLLLLGLFLFERERFAKFFRTAFLSRRAWGAALIVLVMTAPMLAFLWEAGDYSVVIRQIPEGWRTLAPTGKAFDVTMIRDVAPVSGLLLPYGLVFLSGSFANVVDLVAITAPAQLYFTGWSEAQLYMGGAALPLILIGMAVARHRLRRVLLVVAAGLVLLMLGPYGGLHQLLYPVFPPLWFSRHTEQLANFLVFVLALFLTLGVDHLLSSTSAPRLFKVRNLVSMSPSFFVRYLVAWPLLTGGLVYVLLRTATYVPDAVTSVPLSVAFVGAAAVILVFTGRFLGAVAVAAMLGVALTVAASLLTTDFVALWQRQAFFLAVPSILLLLSWHWRGQAGRLLIGLTLPILVLDMVGYADSMRGNWSVPRPDHFLEIHTGEKPPSLPPERRAVTMPKDVPSGRYQQSMRYTEVLARQAVALDLPRGFPQEIDFDDVAADRHLNAPRWNSFVMLNSYFDLLDAEGTALRARLGIGEPLVRFVPEEGAASGAAGSNGNAKIVVRQYGYGEATFGITATAPGTFVFADANHRYWQASVDGREVEMSPAEDHFKAVALGPGMHSITFDYRPYPLWVALVCYYLAIVFALAMVASDCWRRRRSRRRALSVEAS